MNKPTLCKVVLPEGYRDPGLYPFNHGDHVLFLDEISNMPGHAIVVDKSGKVIWGYHTEQFISLTDEEL